VTAPTTPSGSRRIDELCPAMYSPVARPSSCRAAPAKNRSWSAIGPISSLSVSPSGLPVSCASIPASSSPWASTASAILSSAFMRSDGVVSRQPSSKARFALAYARSTSAAPESGDVA
jgi:hypothetical protein